MPSAKWRQFYIGLNMLNAYKVGWPHEWSIKLDMFAFNRPLLCMLRYVVLCML